MDIGSSRSYPAGTLSNFSPHPFVLDGVHCASMEGFLQSIKFKSPEMQEQVCGSGWSGGKTSRKEKEMVPNPDTLLERKRAKTGF